MAKVGRASGRGRGYRPRKGQSTSSRSNQSWNSSKIPRTPKATSGLRRDIPQASSSEQVSESFLDSDISHAMKPTSSEKEELLGTKQPKAVQNLLDSSPPRISIENEFLTTTDSQSQAFEDIDENGQNKLSKSGSMLISDIQRPNTIDFSFEEESQVIMALDVRPGNNCNLGCAYYVANAERLYFMEDCKLGDISLIDTLKLHIEPTIILVPTRISDEALNYLKPEQTISEQIDESSPGQQESLYDLQIRASKEFAYESGKSKLLGLNLSALTENLAHLRVPGESQGVGIENVRGYRGQQESLLQTSGILDLNCELAVGCANAIIAYLNRLRAARFLPGDENAASFVRIKTVEMFSIQGSMFINSNSLEALQIIETRRISDFDNDNVVEAQYKQSLSIYGLFNKYAFTKLGKRRLRQIFLRPSIELDILNDRLDTVTAFYMPVNAPHLNDIVTYLKGFGNINVLLRNLQKGALGSQRGNESSVKMWARLLRFTHGSLCIRDSLREMQDVQRLRIYNRVMNGFDGPSLATVGEAISQIVDFEESRVFGYPVVNQGLDEELDELKRRFNGLESWLEEVSQHFRKIIPSECRNELTSVEVTYYPRIGFVIQINEEALEPIENHFKFTDRPWELAFIAGGHACFKCPEMDEMDEKFDKEVEIMHTLAQNILQYEKEIENAWETCAEVDCFVALALGAQNYSLVRPHMTEENVIDIRAGRHILQEMSVPSYVPNDTFILAGEDFSNNSGIDSSSSQSETNEKKNGPSVIIMTGPNYSGKSVHLKQVAIIVYMGHIGSFVPAETALIGITDKILTRIATKESVSKLTGFEQIQSSFAIDLQQMSFALSQATPRSLLIVDEFGKGTQPDDGAALFCGVMEHLLSLDEHCPKVLASTHFHELFECGFLNPRPRLSFSHMEVRVDPNAAELEDQLVYLYIARDGRSISTFGACCAALNGIENCITQRAEELILLQNQGEDLVVACSSLPPDEMDNLKDAEMTARVFISTSIEETDPRVFLEHCLNTSDS